jgi:hypothetical protein
MEDQELGSTEAKLAFPAYVWFREGKQPFKIQDIAVVANDWRSANHYWIIQAEKEMWGVYLNIWHTA